MNSRVGEILKTHYAGSIRVTLLKVFAQVVMLWSTFIRFQGRRITTGGGWFTCFSSAGNASQRSVFSNLILSSSTGWKRANKRIALSQSTTDAHKRTWVKWEWTNRGFHLSHIIHNTCASFLIWRNVKSHLACSYGYSCYIYIVDAVFAM